MWQVRWSSSDKARIISASFKDVQKWFSASQVKLNHYDMQMMTGHGDFKSRFAALGLAGRGMCD